MSILEEKLNLKEKQKLENMYLGDKNRDALVSFVLLLAGSALFQYTGQPCRGFHYGFVRFICVSIRFGRWG